MLRIVSRMVRVAQSRGACMSTAAKFLRGHGVSLTVLGTVLFVATLAGRHAGAGMFAFLRDNRIAAIAFHEAYALIALLGIALALGAGGGRLRPWQILAAGVHGFLIVINLSHWSFYAELKMEVAGYVSTVGHFALALTELFLLGRGR